MNLSELQKKFTSYIYSAKPTQKEKDEILNLLSKSTRVDPETGLEVYRKNLIFGIIGCLQGIFPQTRRVLGEDNFGVFIRDLVYESPSADHDLRRYGEKFPDFLRKKQELSDTQWLCDMANIEWIWHKLLFISLDTPIGVQKINNIKNNPKTGDT